MGIIRVFAYIGIGMGTLRFLEYFIFGDLHRGYALAWAIHALASGIILLWITRNDTADSKPDN